MLFMTHALFGMLLGNMMGNVLLVTFGAIIVDLDHIFVYLMNGVLFSPKKLWHSMTKPHDPYVVPRTPMHSLPIWLLFTIIMFIIEPGAAKFLSIGYLSHLILDAIDNDDLHIMWPIKGHVRGPLVYNSEIEYILDVALIAIVFLFMYVL